MVNFYHAPIKCSRLLSAVAILRTARRRQRTGLSVIARSLTCGAIHYFILPLSLSAEGPRKLVNTREKIFRRELRLWHLGVRGRESTKREHQLRRRMNLRSSDVLSEEQANWWSDTRDYADETCGECRLDEQRYPRALTEIDDLGY